MRTDWRCGACLHWMAHTMHERKVAATLRQAVLRAGGLFLDTPFGPPL